MQEVPGNPPRSGSGAENREVADLNERYSRQVLFGGIGASGQQRLAGSHAAVVGLGATGAASAGLLARAGVGRLTLIDRDFVEASNLQRQTLFDEADARAALPKAEAAKRHLAAINSSIVVSAHVADLVPGNVAELLGGADIVLDGTDNFETRYLINDFCVQQGKAWIYGAAVGAYAVTLNVLPGSAEALSGDKAGACLACLFPAPPAGTVETCDTAGILSSAATLCASLQTAEALKYLTGQPELMRRTLLSWNVWTGERSEIRSGTANPGCAVCGGRSFEHLAGTKRPHVTLCGRNSVQIHEHERAVDLAALQARLAPLGRVRANGLLLRFEKPPYTLTVFPDGRALIQGTTEVSVARSLYARFIGS